MGISSKNLTHHECALPVEIGQITTSFAVSVSCSIHSDSFITLVGVSGEPTASGSVCGDISCWISAGTLAGILCGVAALITVVVCVVAACVFRRRLRKHKASETLP